MNWLAILQQAIAIALTGIVIGLVTQIALRGRSTALDPATRRIRTHRGILIGLVIGCLAMGGIALYAAIFGVGGLGAFTVGVPFTVFGILTLTGLHPDFDVIWDPNGLEGPATLGLPPFGPKRLRLTYDEIAKIGIDWTGSFFAADSAGNKIRWNRYYAGFAELNADIAYHRPDLIENGH